MIKHTRGPWEIHPRNTSEILADIRDNDGELIVSSVSKRSKNTLLIAAAPDLLQTLKQAVCLLEQNGYTRKASGILVKIDEAIAKAEGR